MKGITHGSSRNFFQQVYNEAISVLTHASFLTEDRQKAGGYFCLLDATTGLLVWQLAFGYMDGQHSDQFLAFSLEKAKRLYQKSDHNSSWESRDVNLMQFGGAVRGQNFIFSFSGFTEHLDEAAMLILASRISDREGIPELPGGAAKVISMVSSNPHYDELFVRCHRPELQEVAASS